MVSSESDAGAAVDSKMDCEYIDLQALAMTAFAVSLTQRDVDSALDEALSRPVHHRGHFFQELRSAFRSAFADSLERGGIEVLRDVQLGHTYYLKKGIAVEVGLLSDTSDPEEADLEFCAGYGHEAYSLTALCEPRAFSLMPSLRPFLEAAPFTIGNILCCVENTDASVDISWEGCLSMVGHVQDISPRKRKSYVALFGVAFDQASIERVAPKGGSCQCDHEDLDEVAIAPAYQYPPFYICRLCGHFHTCECFDEHFNLKHDIMRLAPWGGSEPILNEAAQSLAVRPGICSLCTGVVPPPIYGSSMYFGRFLQSFLPYHRLFAHRQYGEQIFQGDDRHAEIENAVRKHFGFPKIGERWISETMLFRIVEQLFAPLEVVHHYRGLELERLELDIWVPALKLGIEYQGEQHYETLDHWGGEEGLKKRKANDRRKKTLCRELGYQLVEFKHSEDLSEVSVASRLRKFIPERTEQPST